MSLTNQEIFDHQKFRRNDPLWQLIDAVIVWASWAYDETGSKQARERADRCWVIVEEKEQELRLLVTPPGDIG
jgi:hypothetical protein